MAQLLHQTGIVFGQVDGTLSPPQRQEVLKKFHHDSSVKVLLMTLGTGAAGYTSYFPQSRMSDSPL
jgi:SWI/SNF-related matrix-associated actin-dependent regulator of chromatin subfamily A3